MTVEQPMRHETQRLIKECQTISTEAFSVSDMADFIKQRLPRLRAELKDAFRFLTTWDYSRPEVLNVNAVRAKLRQVRYTDLEGVLVAKPVGFQGNLNDYTQELCNQRLGYMTGMAHGVLGETTKFLGYFLNDPENLNERRAQDSQAGYTPAELDAMIEQEARWMVSGNRSSEADFTDLYENNAACGEAMAAMNEANAQRWNKANPRTIAKEVQRLQQVADALFTTIQKAEGITVSRQTMNQLADRIELAARWMEWFSATQARMIDTTTALKHTERTLLRAL